MTEMLDLPKKTPPLPAEIDEFLLTSSSVHLDPSNLDPQKLKIDDSTRISIHVIEVEENHFSSITYHFKMFIDFLFKPLSIEYIK